MNRQLNLPAEPTSVRTGTLQDCNVRAAQRRVASRRRRERDGHGDEPLGGRAVAQLAVAVQAPAVRRAARGYTAAVSRTCTQGAYREADGHRLGDTPRCVGAVAESAMAV